ncbi:glycine cleavage system protein H [bacterium]|nr:glycine cleavage system protein H [bacterium]
MSVKITKTYEWAKLEDGVITIGITAKAQTEIGEIVNLRLPKDGIDVTSGAEVLVLESTKSAIDVYSPFSGKVVAVNKALLQDISLLNKDPENTGWLYKIAPSNIEEYHSLQDYNTSKV